jgi:hypothetical protein
MQIGGDSENGSSVTLTQRWLRRLHDNPIFAVATLLLAVAGLAAGLWNVMPSAVRNAIVSPPKMSTDQLITSRQNLQIIKNRIEANSQIYNRIANNYMEPGWGTQESYYFRARENGADNNNVLRGDIDKLVENNQLIIDNLEKYGPFILTDKFRIQESLFRRHAELYNTRWPSVQRSVASGEPIPTAEPVFPRGFIVALEEEIQALENLM